MEKQASVLSAGARKKKEDELEKLLREYNRLVQDSQAEVKKKEGELTGAIIKESREIIEKIGAEEGYTLIIERGMVIYSNKGIDILTEPNQDVLASRAGNVIFIDELPGYGKTIIIDHHDGFSSVYCGNSSTGVKIGDEVQQGIVIAKTGQSPRKNSGSLHFEIRKKHKPQNPLYYLN